MVRITVVEQHDGVLWSKTYSSSAHGGAIWRHGNGPVQIQAMGSFLVKPSHWGHAALHCGKIHREEWRLNCPKYGWKLNIWYYSYRWSRPIPCGDNTSQSCLADAMCEAKTYIEKQRLPLYQLSLATSATTELALGQLLVLRATNACYACRWISTVC